MVATASAAALVAGLLSWQSEPPEARTLTTGESQRLAATRVTNYRDVRSGVRVTVGAAAARTELVGWLDWARPLAYLDVGGPGAGPDRGLVQATPTVVVARPDPTAVPTPAPPPLVPPTDRWRLRDLPDDGPVAAVLDLLFALGADRPDPAGTPQSRWVGRGSAGGVPVDILQAPLPTPAAARSTATPAPGASTTGGATAGSATGPDGQPRWWIDRDARLHRLEARLPGGVPVTVELERANRPKVWPVPALGGRPGLPRALTEPEKARLARLPARLRAAGGATVVVTAPVGDGANLRGAGWLSWSGRTSYLSVADLDTPRRRTLLRHDATGVTRAVVPAGPGTGSAEAPARPPLPPPAGAGWRRGGSADDLALLIGAALRAGPTGQRGPAVRLRGDRIGGRTVDVIELSTDRSRLRYWIDRAGLLRRVELHTRLGTWAQLDLTPGPVPRLAPPKRPPRPGTAP